MQHADSPFAISETSPSLSNSVSFEKQLECCAVAAILLDASSKLDPVRAHVRTCGLSINHDDRSDALVDASSKNCCRRFSRMLSFFGFCVLEAFKNQTCTAASGLLTKSMKQHGECAHTVEGLDPTTVKSLQSYSDFLEESSAMEHRAKM